MGHTVHHTRRHVSAQRTRDGACASRNTTAHVVEDNKYTLFHSPHYITRTQPTFSIISAASLRVLPSSGVPSGL